MLEELNGATPDAPLSSFGAGPELDLTRGFRKVVKSWILIDASGCSLNW